MFEATSFNSAPMIRKKMIDTYQKSYKYKPQSNSKISLYSTQMSQIKSLLTMSDLLRIFMLKLAFPALVQNQITGHYNFFFIMKV